MDKLLDAQLNVFMKENNIDTRDLYKSHINNPVDSSKMIDIFELKDKEDCALVLAYLFMVNIDSKDLIVTELAKTNSEIQGTEPERKHYLQVLYELYMNPVFELLSFNWLSYTDCMAKENASKTNSSSAILHFSDYQMIDSQYDFDAYAAATAGWPYIDNDKPIEIEGIGRLRFRGHKLTKAQLFAAEFELRDDSVQVGILEFDVIPHLETALPVHFILERVQTATGVVFEDKEFRNGHKIDFRNGFSVKNIKYK